MTKPVISEKWIKASILGTIWAASEIVLGSFLHNLNIPLSGNILTAIGLILLISVSYKWYEKGIFWRAGLVCAIMKTLSPSAVIFGPMIAIFSQSILLEIAVRVLGKSVTGYIIGSMLAMSWNLFQKLINYIIFYGSDIVKVYKDLVLYAQRQLKVDIETIWHPILVLFALYSIFGLIAAIIGINIGKKLLKKPLTTDLEKRNSDSKFNINNQKHHFDYSITWLIVNLLLMINGLFWLNYSPWYAWSLVIISTVSIWIFRYKRALRQLTKSKFWIYFFVITMITAFVFTKIQSQSIFTGLRIGIQMNFRAALIIIGFSVLGTELYSPKIRNLFFKSRFKQIPVALELAFNSLPKTIAAIPGIKDIFKNPFDTLHHIISDAERRLQQLKNQADFSQKVFILTGSIGQGKTTYLQKLINFFQHKGITIGGIYSPRVLKDKETIGYDIIDINTAEREIFLRQASYPDEMKIGRFNIHLEGLKKGIKAIQSSNNQNTKMVIIDEVGLLELQNQGWAKNIEELVRNSQNHILLVIRDSFIEKVVEKWTLNNYQVFHIADQDFSNVSNVIHDQIIS
jgi:nucleoside-triphosphatase THEP1